MSGTAPRSTGSSPITGSPMGTPTSWPTPRSSRMPARRPRQATTSWPRCLPATRPGCPIYNALLDQVLTFGSDIEQAPKKGYFSLRRKVQFVTLHPSTKTRFDVGLKPKGVAPKGRLEAAAEVDRELVGWLKQAYNGAA